MKTTMPQRWRWRWWWRWWWWWRWQRWWCWWRWWQEKLAQHSVTLAVGHGVQCPAFFSTLYFSSWTTGQGVQWPPCDLHILPNCTTQLHSFNTLLTSIQWLLTCLLLDRDLLHATSIHCSALLACYLFVTNSLNGGSNKLARVSSFPCWPPVHF